MSFELSIYKDRFNRERIDLYDIFPDVELSGNVFTKLDDSITFDKIKEINWLVRHLLLNTNYYFDIRRANIPFRGYFTKMQ
jgi:hypothetical protein